ncbi:hypothetical protein BDN71DRAFT_1440275 [Pleurotus eryngii]|uniref:Uncharacterized protein n=1 Tax=Pleurotus eryngii TaxID=5323 RepID=A0A9P6AAF7_PLEER|nr:hypothetical protein BDN71DRAFT_1440275 [Pleurotus eryngii]
MLIVEKSLVLRKHASFDWRGGDAAAHGQKHDLLPLHIGQGLSSISVCPPTKPIYFNGVVNRLNQLEEHDILPNQFFMYKCFYPAVLVLLFIGLVGGTIVDDVLDALQKAVDCASCHALLHPLQALAHLGNDGFVDLLNQFCI